ncbi:alpha/beta hydrolase [Thiohalocapsa marina]|uniref:Alpha/beta hydrolase n=1 Tax=Thiohalocapsa marina TaxID=424902 RepID=A0A5M8FRC8_9GAMM|nr:alpha/beta hydrolase [Thiohalocapsa marina]KAA6186686.1 alpha/beta hydrolase [Thiohalocapsa marina]
MRATTKRLVWILALILFLVAVFAGYAFFISTNKALSRAEAFEFRRMQVARVGQDDIYRFFFISNRVAEAGSGPLDARLGNQRSAELHFGSFDTEIEPTLGLGMWLDANSWFLDEEIRISNLTQLDRTAFVQQMRGMVSTSPHRGLLLIVHGLRTDFDYAMRGTAFLAHILDINAPVMVFDWPSNQGDTLRGYREARRVATASGAELAATLRLLIDEVRPERLWVLANSLGAQVVVDAMDVLAADPALADAEREITDVVLTAPDVGYEHFNTRFKAQLKALVEDTTIYVSSNDRALLLSRVVNMQRRLGQSTLDKADAELVEEVEQLLQLVDSDDSGRVQLVDVTPVNRTRNFHNFSLEIPEYFDDIFLRLTNSGVPSNRERYELRTPDGKHYSVLTRGR